MSKIKKSYNPLKMWGSWVGLGLSSMRLYWVVNYTTAPGTMSWFNCLTTIEMCISIIIFLAFGFLIGWGIHSLFRRFKK